MKSPFFLEINDRFPRAQVRVTEALHDAEGLGLDRVQFGTRKRTATRPPG